MSQREVDIIGVGWRFPPAIDGRGGLALSWREQEIEESIEIIISTAPGQRVMRPEFGCRIHELQFAPLNSATASAAIFYVQDALARWEPRIEVVEVLAEADPLAPGCLLVYLTYRVKATHDERALVYPFYTIPGED